MSEVEEIYDAEECSCTNQTRLEYTMAEQKVRKVYEQTVDSTALPI